MFLNFLCKELGMLRLNWIIDVEKDTLSYSYRRTTIIFLLISFTIKQLYSLVISNLMPCNAIIASYYFSSNIATFSPSITSSGSASTSNTSTHSISPYWFIQYPLRARFFFGSTRNQIRYGKNPELWERQKIFNYFRISGENQRSGPKTKCVWHFRCWRCTLRII